MKVTVYDGYGFEVTVFLRGRFFRTKESGTPDSRFFQEFDSLGEAIQGTLESFWMEEEE